MSAISSPAQLAAVTQVALFADGPGYIFVKALESKNSNIFLVRSLEDGRTYIRKELTVDRLDPDEALHHRDVQMPLHLRHVSNVVQPVGWAEYVDANTNDLVNVSYWPYFEDGTLGNLEEQMKELRITMPMRWIWSILEQQLRTLLNATRSGVVHHDAHANNWFVHHGTTSDIPHLVLGDWGMAEPRQEPVGDESDRNWFQNSYIDIQERVVRHIRYLLVQGRAIDGSGRQYLDNIVSNISGAAGGNLPALVNILNRIEDLTPTNFIDMEEWLNQLEIICDAAAAIAKTIPCFPPSPAKMELTRPVHSTDIPTFSEALLNSLFSAGEVNLEFAWPGAPAQVDLWYVGDIDTSTIPYTILSITDGPPNNFKDVADGEKLPPEWREAQQSTRALVEQLYVPENHDSAAHGYEDYTNAV